MSSTSTLDPAPPVCCDVASEVASLAGAANLVMARLVSVVAEAMAAGVTDEAGMKTPAAWLAWRSGLSPERAGQLVRLARVRDRFPLLFGAFERGEVSVDQMTELVKAPEWAEAQMLAFAEIGTVARLRRAIRDEAFEPDPDEPVEDKARREPADRVSFGTKGDRWQMIVNLPIDLGRGFEASLVESKDRLFDDGNPDGACQVVCVSGRVGLVRGRG